VRDGGLIGRGQAVDFGQDGGTHLAVREVTRTSAAAFANQEQDALPEQQAWVILDALLVSPVRDNVAPAVEVGDEVPDWRGGQFGVQCRGLGGGATN
jgi:hypothetical protein